MPSLWNYLSHLLKPGRDSTPDLGLRTEWLLALQLERTHLSPRLIFAQLSGDVIWIHWVIAICVRTARVVLLNQLASLTRGGSA